MSADISGLQQPIVAGMRVRSKSVRKVQEAMCDAMRFRVLVDATFNGNAALEKQMALKPPKTLDDVRAIVDKVIEANKF